MTNILNTANDDGYVYLVKQKIPSNAVYKIGHCSLSKGRLAEYTKLPYDIEYIGLWRTAERESIEKDLHNAYKNKRLNGEWFDLNEDDISKIKNYFKKLEIPNEILDNGLTVFKPIIPIKKWIGNEKPKGYKHLYVIRYKNGMFEEQDLGEVPYLYKSYSNNVPEEYYPTIEHSLAMIERQNYVNNENNKDTLYMKTWGKDRHECYQKLRNILTGRLESEEDAVKRIRKNNDDINQCLKIIDEAENYL